MQTLVIETSTNTGSVAVLGDDGMLAGKSFPGGRGGDAFLFSSLREIMDQAGEIDQVLVGVGPGGYSGLRVGISAALGLKMGRGVPAAGIYSVLGYAAADYQVVIDGRGVWIFAEVQAERLVMPPILLDTAELLRRLNGQIPIYSAKPLPGGFVTIPEAPQAAVLGRRQSCDLTGPPLPLNPVYLKPPHITPSRSSLEWTGGI